MPRRLPLFDRRIWAAGLLLALLATPARSAERPPDPAAALDALGAAAEKSLRDGETQMAESAYRSALLEGWLLLGDLAALSGDVPVARAAFDSATSAAVDNRRALRARALLSLQTGDAASALAVLARLAAQQPGDLELTFDLAGAHLQAKQTERAQELFAEILRKRPLPQTHVLVGRTYRDAALFDLATTELQAALRQDPRVRRAHYYLGTIALRAKGRSGLDDAIREFQAELALAPGDPLSSLELGAALVLTQRPAEALPALLVAARQEPVAVRTLAYLGRAQQGAGHPEDAAASLQRALDMAVAQGANAAALRAIHLPLAQALRTLGRADEAARHFAEAQRLSAEGTEREREELAQYFADVGASEGSAAGAPAVQDLALAALPPAARKALQGRVAETLARIYLNLGVLQAQNEKPLRAAELFEKAHTLQPGLAQVDSSLGVAYFNAREFAKATAPLTRALASVDDPKLKRLLALAWLNTEDYEKAAPLLADDPERSTNPSLQFAYGLSLVKLERAAEAEQVFSALLRAHGDSAELSVLLGQAHAQQGDFASAIASLQRALALSPGVAEANATLGVIYLRQGNFAEAEQALRAGLAAHPDDLRSQQNLAVVLDSLQRGAEAIPLLEHVLAAKPDFATARYLVGKILLAQGNAALAVEHLEAATRLAPDDAPAHYQLGQAYQKVGRTDEARAQFEIFQKLKAKR